MSNRLRLQTPGSGAGPMASSEGGRGTPLIVSSLLPCNHLQNVLKDLPSGFYKGEFVSLARSTSAPLHFTSAGFKFKRADKSYTIALIDKGWPSSAPRDSALTVKQIWEVYIKKIGTGTHLKPFMMVNPPRNLATESSTGSSYAKSVSFTFDKTVRPTPHGEETIAQLVNSIKHGVYSAHLWRNTTDADQALTFVEFQVGERTIRWSLADPSWHFRNGWAMPNMSETSEASSDDERSLVPRATGVPKRWFQSNVQGKPNPVISCKVVIINPPRGRNHRAPKFARLFLNTQVNNEVALRGLARLPAQIEGVGYR